jgi:adenosine deaminase
MKVKSIINYLIVVQLFVSMLCFSQVDSIKINNYLNDIKGDQVLLNQFFTEMPKGGDLHNHLTGSVYAETYFDLATKDKLWVDLDNGKLLSKDDRKVVNKVQLSDTMSNLHAIRMKLIDLWSVRNFVPAKSALAPDEFFFGTFGLFSAATNNHMIDLLKELKTRAAKERVQYLEIMATSPSIDVAKVENYTDLNKWLVNNVHQTDKVLIEKLKDMITQFNKNKYLNQQSVSYLDSIGLWDRMSGTTASPVCKYLAYTSRGDDPMKVFARLYISFKSCADDKSNKIVGVNIVSAENGENSMLFYHEHMLMFQVLKNQFPNVKTSLHAGELTLGLVKPEDLGSHIWEAVTVANSDRIGHGVDIAFEDSSIALISKMKDKKHPIAVEINLVSNEFILGVKDKNHPFPLYFKNNVPIVISTDDPGILRTNLAEQYTLLVLRYNLNYYEIKKLVRNSITYSFSTENEKTILLKTVNDQFSEFETKWIKYINNINKSKN